MKDKRITIISDTNDLSRRIVEVNAGLSKWLDSECDYDSEKDMVRLIKSEKHNGSYIYRYEVLKGECLHRIPSQRGLVNERDKSVREWVLRPVEGNDMPDFAFC